MAKFDKNMQGYTSAFQLEIFNISAMHAYQKGMKLARIVVLLSLYLPSKF